ncbi:uncharacterized protein LOC131955131 [Physella acuta]|uniref:uncharacterized protein LOC131955131 n=1 Tax=Physella acuta TaxID=109671 RepID=UPI0027DE89E8|nr:uncharacterized protein LOC131955131 [Physella acuta]
MNRQEVCLQIVQGLENVWNENILFDFAVRVQDKTIECHRLVLAACSEFFRALFRSGMKEVTENCVVLEDVSCQVFRLILDFIYKGINTISPDNFIEVWRAAHMLQFNFLVSFCEEFSIGACSLDTWENIYTNAKLFGSEKVLNHLHTFMLKNFEQISLSSTFLQLSFNELENLLKSQDLGVTTEDLVLQSVIKWIEYVSPSQINECLNDNLDLSISNNDLKTQSTLPSQDENEFEEKATYLNDDTRKDVEVFTSAKRDFNDMFTDLSKASMQTVYMSRKDKLTELLKLVRTHLVSPALLSEVLKMELVLENEDSKKILVDAVSYHTNDFRHGQWPSAAIHRSSSEYIHAGVFAVCPGLLACVGACSEEPVDVVRCENIACKQLVTFDNELYATGIHNNQPNGSCQMFLLRDKDCREIIEMPSQNVLLIAFGDFIYVVNKDDGFIYNINPKDRNPSLDKLTQFPENIDVKHASIVENFLLLFCSEMENGNDETAIHKMDFSSQVWTKINNLEGPAEQLISFRNDNFNYILQTNGSLWLVPKASNNGNIEFTFLAKLWNFQKSLYGALTFYKKLIIMDDKSQGGPPDESCRQDVPGHFDSISFWGRFGIRSNFVPITKLKPTDLD